MAQKRFGKRHKLMLRWGIPCLLATGVIGYVAFLVSVREDPAAVNADGSVTGLTSVLEREISADMLRFSFEEISDKAGIRFRHFPSQRNSLLPEDMGSGLAWGDYDNDGDDDLFVVNFYGTILNPIPAEPDAQGECKLYRNEGEGRFQDVSSEAGLDLAVFGMAAAWGDYDNDSDLDLYITAYGPNLLFRNNGDGTFDDVTDEAQVRDDRFSAGCAWGDYDRDGHIDLYVCTYTDFQYTSSEPPVQRAGVQNPFTINPSSYPPDTNRLYHNNGDGTFSDVAMSAGAADPTGRSLGVVWFDFNNDQQVDLYVANDVSANAVLLNQGNGTFADIGASSLAADYRGAMGLAVGDIDADDDFDLLVTHWVAQENALYLNQYADVSQFKEKSDVVTFFTDSAEEYGVGQVSLKTVGWGTSFIDFDNDGHLDLWIVNGSTLQFPDDAKHMQPQLMHIYRQIPPRGFFEVGRYVCERLKTPMVGRGGAHADFDGDGRMDLAVQVHGGSLLLLHNTSTDTGHWLQVQLQQQGRNTQALGARVTVRTGDVVQCFQVGAGGTYLSQSPNRLHFGLGDAETVDEVSILWPDGQQEQHADVPVDQLIRYSHRSRAHQNLSSSSKRMSNRSRPMAESRQVPEEEPLISANER